jgi:hypothetical protein
MLSANTTQVLSNANNDGFCGGSQSRQTPSRLVDLYLSSHERADEWMKLHFQTRHRQKSRTYCLHGADPPNPFFRRCAIDGRHIILREVSVFFWDDSTRYLTN